MNQNNIPAELRALTQWVCWSLEQRPGQPKPTKVPKNALGNAATTRPEDWMTFDAAVALAAEKKLSGIGFVFTKDDPYVGVDLDGLLDPKTLAMTPAAQDIVQTLAPAYTEISQSGKGIHIIVRGTLPAGARRKGPIEVYSEGRYFAITGNILAGSVATVPDRTEALGDFHRKYLSGADDTAPAAAATTAPTPEAVTAVLAKVEASPDARFFTTLYEFGETRPGKSASESDMAMAAMLAKYTRSADTIEAIMKASALKRPKWNESRPMPGRKDGTILRRVIAAALRQVPERKVLHSVTHGGLMSVGELLKNPDLLKPPEPVVPGLAWKGRITLVAAAEGLGKSTLFAAAAAAVTLGSRFLMDPECERKQHPMKTCACFEPCAQGAVVWVLVEEHANDFVIRAVTYDPERKGVDQLFLLDRPSEALAELRASVAAKTPRLVIIDTLHAWAGPLVEHTSQSDDWQTIMATLDDIARQDNAPALLMAAQAVKGTGDYRDSSAIGHGVDVVMTLKKFANDELTRELVVKKARWTVAKTTYTRAADGSLRKIGNKQDDTAAATAIKLQRIESNILAYVASCVDQGATQAKIEVAEGIGGSAADRRAACARLLAANRLTREAAGRPYFVASAAVLDPNAVATASGATM